MSGALGRRKPYCAFGAFTVFLLLFAHHRATAAPVFTTITFEEPGLPVPATSPTLLPSQIGDMQFTPAGVVDYRFPIRPLYDVSNLYGHIDLSVSGTNGMSLGPLQGISASLTGGGLFNFVSAFFGSTHGASFSLTGYRDGVIVYSSLAGSPQFTPTEQLLNWLEIDRLTIISGQFNSGYNAFDNLTYSIDIPEPPPPPLCLVSPNDDVCSINSLTDQQAHIDAEIGQDTLQLGGSADFVFQVSRVGTDFTNFELLKKVDSSNVTLTGVAPTAVNWEVDEGTLTASGGNAIGDTSQVTVGFGAIFRLQDSESIGHLHANHASILDLAGNTLTLEGGVLAGGSTGTGGVTKNGSDILRVLSNQGYTGLTVVNAGTLDAVNSSFDGGLQVGAGALFTGSNVVVAGTVTNFGEISPGNDSIGNHRYLSDYVGGGTILMGIAANLGATPDNDYSHDHLRIDGNVSGVTAIELTLSGLPTQTNHRGFELVSVGGSTQPDAFKLADGPFTYMGFYYYLSYVVADGFFLNAAPICMVDDYANTCLISSTTPQFLATDALGDEDMLQLGGERDFSFDAASIGNTYKNFEIFQKANGSNVTLLGTATTAADWDIQDGTLTVSGGDAVFDTSSVYVGAGAMFSIATTERLTRLTGAGLTTIAEGQTLTLGDGSNFSYSGATTGNGNLTKVGSGTIHTLSLDHLGLTTVSGGELHTTGSISGNVLIAPGAKLSGSFIANGTLTNNGTLNPGNSPGTQAFGGYVAGPGAAFNMEVEFNNADAPVNGVTHDFVNIAGATSGSVTLLNIVPYAPSDAPTATTGNGVELVRVGGTPGLGASQFALSSPVFLGPYQYVLNYVPDYAGSLDGYFLRSQIAEGVYGDAAMLSAGQSMTRACYRTMQEPVSSASQSSAGRGWAQYTQGTLEAGADTGVAFDQDYNCGAGGVDIRIANYFRAGVSGGLGNTTVDVRTAAGSGRLRGDVGLVQALFGYADEGRFANLSLGYSSTDWDFDGPLTAPISATTTGVVGSLQGGMSWPLGDFRVGTTAALNYDDAHCIDHCLMLETTESITHWSTEISLRVDGSVSGGKLLPFIALTYSDHLDGANVVMNQGATLISDANAGLLHAKAGVSAFVDDRTELFANAGVTEDIGNDTSGVDGTAGVRMRW